MIGAKKFEMEDSIPTKNTTIKTKPPANRQENEASLDKIKGNLLDAFKKNPPERMFSSSSANKKEMPKQKKEHIKHEGNAPGFFTPLLKKMDALYREKQEKNEKEEEEQERTEPTVSRADIHKISYMVFSNIRRYLDQKENLQEKNKKISIEIQL